MQLNKIRRTQLKTAAAEAYLLIHTKIRFTKAKLPSLDFPETPELKKKKENEDNGRHALKVRGKLNRVQQPVLEQAGVRQ